MVSAGIVKGSDGCVNPLGKATRAEVAVMCARLYDLIKQQKVWIKMAKKLEIYEILAIALVLFIIVLIFVSTYVNCWLPFKSIRDYIKREMERSSGKEYNYWKYELKMLYINSIPFLKKKQKR